MENMADLEPLGDGADNGLGRENLPAIVGEMTVVPAFIADGVNQRRSGTRNQRPIETHTGG
jgi:hypothetical protein